MRSALFHRLLALMILLQASCTGADDKYKAEGDEPKTPKRNSYELWQHGAAGRERKALAIRFKTKVDGTTHESEHPIGVFVLLGAHHKLRSKNRAVRSVENCAPAYQEVEYLHKAHIGTGTKNKPDASGFNSHTYREATKALLKDQKVAVAIQLNQLGYAFNPDFRGDTVAHRVADASFETMARDMKTFSYYEGNSLQEASLVSEEDRWEMLIARHIARTSKWPTEKELAVMKAEMRQEEKEELTPLVEQLKHTTISDPNNLDL